MLYGYVDRQPQLPNGDAMLTLACITTPPLTYTHTHRQPPPRPAHIHAQSDNIMAHPANVNGQRLKNSIEMIT